MYTTKGSIIENYLIARNAFNGLFLWQYNLGKTCYGGLFYPNRSPLAAVNNRVYAASDKREVLVFESGTGRIINRLDTEYVTGRLLVDDGVVVTANWDSESVGGIGTSMLRWGESKVRTGTVEAFDALTGKKMPHNGIDFATVLGGPVVATADGVITSAERVPYWGKRIEITHTHNLKTVYAHLKKIRVVSGNRVEAGDIIGYVGSSGTSSGNHLHYEIWEDELPVPPKRFLRWFEGL